MADLPNLQNSPSSPDLPGLSGLPSSPDLPSSPKPARKAGSLLAVVRVAAVLALLVALGVLGWQLYNYRQSSEAYSELQSAYTTGAAEPGAAAADAALQIDFEGLLQQNKDVVAWIDFDSLPISYPILHGADNGQYLRRLLDGRYATAGSLFLESNNTSMDDLYTIVYGHNMIDGTMFGQLKDYRDPDFYAQNGGWFTVYLPDGRSWRYQIFGFAEVPADDALYTVGFFADDTYRDFLKRLCGLRLYETGVSVYSTDHIMALSTCTDDGARRFVALARRDSETAPQTPAA